MVKNKEFLALKLSYAVLILLINVKRHFNIYEQDKVRAQLSLAWIFFIITSAPGLILNVHKKVNGESYFPFRN